MKSRALLWTLPLLVAVSAFAFRWFDVPRRVGLIVGGRPVIEVPQDIDLGEQEQGATALATFAVKNAGTAALQINDFETDCGCSGVERRLGESFASVSAVEVAPGESCELCLRLPVRGDSGRVRRFSVQFRTNDPGHESVQVGIRLKVTGRVIAVPAQLLLGTIPHGKRYGA